MSNVIELDESSFESEVLASETKIVVDFYTSTCPPCKAMAPIIEELASEDSNGIRFAKIDAAAFPNISANYGVRAVPTFILFSNGESTKQRTGSVSKTEFRKWIEE